MRHIGREALLLLAAVLTLMTATAKDWASVALADRPGATVKGIVYAGDKPLKGVAVSDGVSITLTDAEGRYWLPTDKRSGSVFISIPSGYEVSADGVFPRFWAALEAPAGEVERHDFPLTEVDNDRHVMLAVTDIHLSNQNSDLEQFCTRFIPDVKQVAAGFGDTPVYTLNMGDSAWDAYWYSNRYSLKDFRRTMNIVGYPSQMFCAMGNHDNDGATIHSDSVDFAASAPFRKIIGPRYYSFNIGKVHYVVLDNLIYVNTPKKSSGSDGIAGKRDYIRRVDPVQLEWLRRDLALVKDKSAPVVVAMHAAAFRYKFVTDEVQPGFSQPAYSEELKACFDGFKDVHFVSGHIHKNLLSRVNEHLIEHNMGAVCGSWWRTGANHFQMLGPDAGPNGYTIFTIDGKRMEWTYRSIEDGDKQFREAMSVVLDELNAVKPGVGFALGAKAANPDVKVSQVVLSSANSNEAYETAMNMISSGTDLIFPNADAGNVGAIKAVSEHSGTYSFGVFGDYIESAPQQVIANMMPDAPGAYVAAFDAIMNGEAGGEVMFLGMAEGIVNLVWNEDVKAALPEDVVAAAEQAMEDIKSGAIEIPNEYEIGEQGSSSYFE